MHLSVLFMQDIGCRTTYFNNEVIKHSEIVILAVKPPLVETVLRDIQQNVTHKHLMISIAAGITLQTIEQVGLWLAMVSAVNAFAFYLGLAQWQPSCSCNVQHSGANPTRSQCVCTR